MGLGHTDDVGDDETLDFSIPVKVGGTVVDFYPRFTWSPRYPGGTMGALTFDASRSFAKDGIASYSWDFGNGNAATGSTATHTFAQPGDYPVSLTLTDAAGNSSVVEKTVRVRPTNHPPSLGDNLAFEMEQGGTLSFDLKAAKDWEGDSLTYSVGDSPPQGTLSQCLNGDADLSCQYAPPGDFTGEVVFSYRANDGTSDSLNAARVTIDVMAGPDGLKTKN